MTSDYRIIILLLADGLLNWLQNIIAFSVLSLVTPLTYAVASASKRIFVIAVSLLILGNPVTWLNIFGMLLAIIGVLIYNRVSVFSSSSFSLEIGLKIFARFMNFGYLRDILILNDYQILTVSFSFVQFHLISSKI